MNRKVAAAARLVLAVTGVHAVPFSYSGPRVLIPDGLNSTGAAPGAQVGADVTVSGISTPISKVTLSIDGTACTTAVAAPGVGIDHSYVSELRITLRSPAGTEVPVIVNVGGGGRNLCQVALDDGSVGPSIDSVTASQAPFSGIYTPSAPLAAFEGEPANGTWTLLAQDFFIGDTGSIRAWTIDIAATPSSATSIPTLSEWGLIIASSIVGLFGLCRLRRRS